MPKRRTLSLTPEQESDLVRMRDHDRRPYMRERAAALLKIASGMSPHAVALHGLLKRRDRDTVYRWLDDYEANGCIKPRPPCRGPFSPGGPGASGRPRSPQPPTNP